MNLSNCLLSSPLKMLTNFHFPGDNIGSINPFNKYVGINFTDKNECRY